MKTILIITFIISPFIGHSQTDSEKTYKNDIAIIYGADLNYFSRKIPGLEYRRSLNENWKIKLGVMGNRLNTKSETIYRTEFPISDTAIIKRQQLLQLRVGRTIKLGVDYTKLEHFSFGAQFIFGKGAGLSFVHDQAYYDISIEEDYEHYVYSEELTVGYHPPQSNPNGGTIQIGYRRDNVASLDYWIYGLGLTAEAKWPIGKHFEAALQYNPELLYYSPRSTFDYFEKDTYYTADFKGIVDFGHFANLFLRFKF